MSSPIRALVVDDSVVVRRVITTVLSADPDVEVAGVASDGAKALVAIRNLEPDVVTLDVEMPYMDGIQTLAEIRKEWPRLPVIMFSTLTERGAQSTIEALSLGASDYVTKPSNTGNLETAIERIRDSLIPKIKALCLRPAAGAAGSSASLTGAIAAGLTPAAPAAPAKPLRSAGPKADVDVIVIGVSTGGPNALSELLPMLPGDLRVPVAIVQHMPPTFTRMLAESLDKKCKLHVVEASDGEAMEPGKVLIAPGDFHLRLQRNGVNVVGALDQGPQEQSCRPAVDPLFRSAAEVYGPGVLSVVLTGMGRDGAAGARVVLAAGGQCIAQDEATSVVWGMPGEVAAAGLADAIIPLPDIADALVQRVNRRGLITASVGAQGGRA